MMSKTVIQIAEQQQVRSEASLPAETSFLLPGLFCS